MEEKQTYFITVNHPVLEAYKSFDTKDEARLWGAAQRKAMAEKMGVGIFDLWFDVEEYEEPEHDSDCTCC